MKYFKRLAAAICAVAITLSVAGCADVSTIGSVDNQTINAGIYLLYEQTAIGEAQQEVDDQLKAMGTSASKIENFSYYNYNVQDKTFSQYVQDRTLEQVKQYVAIQNKFKELNLSLTDEEEDTVKTSVKKMWDTEISYYGYSTGKTYGQNYEAGGISKKSYEAVQLVNKMSEKVFDAYYEKGWIDKVITTNLNYRIPELLTRPYYVEANMSKYLASIMDIINHDVSVEKVRSSNEKIMDLMKRVNQ